LASGRSTTTSGGVLGATVSVSKGTLPFTGFPLWLVAVIGLMLIVGAVAARGLSRAATPRS
jgi:hypothetical protein